AMPPLADPVAAGQLQEQRTVEAARRAVIDILDRGQMAQLGGLGAAFEALLLAQRALALKQDAEPLGMAEGRALRVIGDIPEALGHAVQAELGQQVERWMSEQSRSPNGSSGSRGCCRAATACRPRLAATPSGRAGVAGSMRPRRRTARRSRRRAG